MKQESKNFICFVIVCIASLIMTVVIMRQQDKIGELELELIKAKSDGGYGTEYNSIGYFVDFPDAMSAHIIVNTQNDYEISDYRRALLKATQQKILDDTPLEDWNKYLETKKEVE